MEHPRPLLAGGHETRLAEHLEVVRGVRHPHPGALGEGLDAPLTLGEQVDVGQNVFHLEAFTATLTYIVAFGAVKAGSRVRRSDSSR